jgi:glycerophosphoryl diester phosphodiesterase
MLAGSLLAAAVAGCSSEASKGDSGSLATAPPETSAAPATAAPTTAATTTVVPTTAAPTTTAAPSARSQVQPPEASTVAELLALDRPIVIAHAGGDFEGPHSTMYAYTEAALLGTDVLELDVMLTNDRVLVVQHDDTVDRTTETTGPVRDLTYDELRALDNAHWFSGDTWGDQSLPDEAYTLRGVRTGAVPPPAGYTPDDFTVPTFRDVAEAFPDHVLDVEIKIPRSATGDPDLAWAIEGAQVLADEIAELGRTDSVIVVSFDVDVLAAFRQFAPDVATSPGLATLVDWYVGQPIDFAPTDVVFQVPPVYEGVEVLTPDVVARAQAEGFEVWVWMDDTDRQENAEFFADLLGRGVDGLLVARPSVAIEVVAAES